MTLILLSLGVFLAAGSIALCGGSSRWSTWIGAGGVVLGSCLGLLSISVVVLSGSTVTLRMSWEVPYGSFSVALDPLSAFFLLPIFFLSAVTAIYGSEYLQAYREQKSLGASWFFFNVLVTSMTLVVIARNGLLFLVAWEIMAIASFFLMTFEDEQESVREAGQIYLIATHCGTAFLLVLFLLLGQQSGSLDFDQFSPAAGPGLLFMLAVIGFGAKAGFMPLHVWLPEAHPAAPTHVSALMSGVMIKTGLYGLVRVLTFLGPPALWWGWVLCGVGLFSGILGILYALAQRDLKRVLAYSSIENIGIITFAFGLGLIGMNTGTPTVAVLGVAGALLHVVHHTLFKGLLFLAAGAVVHGTGTRDINSLGGLLKRMPWTGCSFLLGAVAIVGLPPLNGFVGEFLIYLGAFHGAMGLNNTGVAAALGIIAGLALIGGLATACFSNVFGMVFLGEPRTPPAARAHEAGLAMRVALVSLASGCVLVAVFAPWVLRTLIPLLSIVTGFSVDVVASEIEPVSRALSAVVMSSCGLLIVIVGLGGCRQWLLRARQVTTQVTWDCGYARPTPRMQYTASSFTQPLTNLAQLFLRTRSRQVIVQGVFPQAASLVTETPDVFQVRFYYLLFSFAQRAFASLRWIQQGQVQLYILYIALTLLVLLIWQLG
ncbi:MAG: proton-conducting transporter membrane subunit [Candidatus Binatia bacterium]